jgi:hypothetical protein
MFTALTPILLTLPLLIHATPTARGANTATVINSCPYPIHLTSVPQGAQSKILQPHTTYTETIRVPSNNGGVSIKLSKTASGPVNQFEYTLDKKTGVVYYDMSLIDCVKGRDSKQCVGHEKGLSLSAGKGCKAFKCRPGEYCDKQAYFIPEAGYAKIAPVAGCAAKGGLVFELCSGGK